MYLQCSACDVKQRNCRDWYGHLCSEKHQLVAKDSINNCSSEMGFRTIVCWDFDKEMMKSLILDEKYFVTYFASFGLIHDIYFKKSMKRGRDGAMSACLVLFDSSEMAKSVMTELQNGNRRDTVPMKAAIGSFKRRCDVSGHLFHKVMGNPVEEVFLRRHNELVDICEGISLEQQFYEFVSAASLSNEDIEKREMFLRELEQVLRFEIPNCKCKSYGSYLIGVGDKDSDLDVFVDVRMSLTKLMQPDSEMMDEENNSLDQVFELALMSIRRNNYHKLGPGKERGRNDKKRYRSIIPIQARVPIIRLIHEETELHCDLSFNSVLSIYNSKLMKFYIQYDPRVRPFMMFLRYWGRFYSLLGSNRIKTYGLMLMAVVFLNQQQIVPNLYFLQLLYKGEPLVVDGWNAAFVNNVDVVHAEVDQTGFATPRSCPRELSYVDILELVHGFFQIFGSLDFEEKFVCPFQGTLGEKLVFLNQDSFKLTEFPAPYEKLKNFRQSPLCVQDPFVLDFNVTNNVTRKLLKRFTSICTATAISLKRLLRSNTGNLFSTLFLNTEAVLSKNPKLTIIRNVGDSSDSIQGLSVASSQQVVQSFAKTEATQFQPNLNFDTDSTMASNAPFSDYLDIEDDPASVEIENIPQHPFSPVNFSYSSDYSISEEFKELFMKVLSPLDTKQNLEHRMKIAWTLFAVDFFSHIFDKGFGLNMTQRKLPYQEIPEFKIEEAIEGRLASLLPYFIEVTVDENAGVCVIQILSQTEVDDSDDFNHSISESQTFRPLSKKRKRDSDHISVLNETEMAELAREGDLPEPPSSTAISLEIRNRSVVHPGPSQNSDNHGNNNDDGLPKPKAKLLSTFSAPLNEPQENYSKLQIGLRKPFSTELVVQGSASGFIGRKRRHFGRALYFQKSLLSANPLNLEESATKSFKALNDSLVESQMQVNFLCSVTVDTNHPFAMVHMTEVLENPEIQLPVVHLIRDTGFGQMFHQYMVFRLKKLLFGAKND